MCDDDREDDAEEISSDEAVVVVVPVRTSMDRSIMDEVSARCTSRTPRLSRMPKKQ